MIDLYEVLQVDRGAEPEVIRAAYRALARKHHPDFGGDASRMAAINDAWGVLGDPSRRAAYDSEPQAAGSGQVDPSRPAAQQPTGDGQPAGMTGVGLAGRRPSSQQGSGTVLDFGRYAGWTVGSLASHDPGYLEWLARTPIGRRLTGEIAEALARQAVEAAPPRPTPQRSARRRAFL